LIVLGKGADENKMKPVSHVANLFGLIFKVNTPVGTSSTEVGPKHLKQRLAIESVTIAKWNQQKHSQMLEDDAKMSISYPSPSCWMTQTSSLSLCPSWVPTATV
jgi:hypothetical protein